MPILNIIFQFLISISIPACSMVCCRWFLGHVLRNGGNICLCRQEDFLNGNFCNGTYAEIFKRCAPYPCPGWREIPGQCACNQMNTTTYQFCDSPAPQHNWSLCNCTELVSLNSCNGTYAEVFESCGHNPCPICSHK